MSRFASSVLWLFAIWYVSAAFASLAGMPDVVAPALGLAVGGFVALDPTHKLWTARATHKT